MPSMARSIALFLLLAVLSVHGVRRVPPLGEHATQDQEEGRRRLSVDNDHQQRETAQSAPPPHDPRALADPDTHLVSSLPLLPDGLFPTRHWAGHLPAAGDGSDKKLFYWLFEPGGGDGGGNPPPPPPGDAPLVLWINGGPGCSSMDGLWLENGPFRLTQRDAGWTIDVNPHSWHNAPAWTLYVDQPVGTGLSFTKKKTYCKNDFEVNRDFHYFLEEFFLFHGDKFLSSTSSSPSDVPVVNRPFYFSGESHAGHYIPSMMDFILQRNDRKLVATKTNGLSALRVDIPLSGAAIGNGWIDPYHQYAAADAAYGAGLIGAAQRASFEKKEKDCQRNLKSGNYRSSVCFALLDDIVNQSGGRNGRFKVSQYDNRLWESRGAERTFPHGHKEVETYLGGHTPKTNPPIKVNYKDVLAAIHATESISAGLTYAECTDPPYIALEDQDGLGVVDELVRVLDHASKPQMLIFNGINDLICNHVGNEKALDSVPWSGAAQYVQQPRHAWDSGVDASLKNNYNPGRPDGYVKQFANLTFLKILESGHMVPMDQPAVALAMMRTLLHGMGGFISQTYQQNLPRASPDQAGEMCKLDQCPDCPHGPPNEPADHSSDNGSIVGTAAGVSTISFAQLTLSNLGVMAAAFALGIIFTVFCQRQRQRAAARQVLASIEDDMELTDQDSVYRDDDGEYT